MKVLMVVFVRKLEVVHMQVGGGLISYNLQLACVVYNKEVGGYLTRCAHFRVDPYEWHYGESVSHEGRY